VFTVGELIVHGGEGVCRVEAVGLPDIPTVNPDRLYYTLCPLYREGKTYTPVDSGVYMRPVISHDEAVQLIRAIPDVSGGEPEGDFRARAEHYEQIIKTNDCMGLAQMIKAVYAKQAAGRDKKKKLGQIDAKYRKRAEDMLFGELAVALGIERDDVRPYIEEMLHIEPVGM
jgi:CarD family transcriptional regulator